MRVYHRVGAGRPLRVVWMLEEIGVPYDLVVLTPDQAKLPGHLARHPLGRVPVIETEDGLLLFESAAVCLHIADLHPDAGLIPAAGEPGRALAYQWVLFTVTEIEPPMVEEHRCRESAPAVAGQAADRCGAAAQAVEAVLAEHDYLVGDAFSVADVITGEVLRFAATDPQGPVGDYLARLEQRPARRRALARLDQR